MARARSSAGAPASRDPQWWLARRDASGQAPGPGHDLRRRPPGVRRARRALEGAPRVHTWIAVKPTGAPAYTRYEVIGWGVDRGLPALRVNRTGPDNYWVDPAPDGAKRSGTRPDPNFVYIRAGSVGAARR